MRVSRVGSFVPGVVALLSLLVAAAGPLEAQQTILMGTVRNEEGEPVNAATFSRTWRTAHAAVGLPERWGFMGYGTTTPRS